MLLEICVKSEHFSVIFQPWGLDSGDVIVLRGSAVLEEGQLTQALSQLVDEILINFLFQILFLLLNTPVHKIELLGLVEILLIRITEDVTRKERYLFWNIFLHV